jgi:acid stress chaperone HdeB
MKMMRGTKMMRSRWLDLLLMLLALSTAQAQTTLDIAKITCEQFITVKVDSPENIAIWLSGYYHGKRGSTTVDVEGLKEQPRKIETYCLYKDQGGTVMEAIEKLHLQRE